MSSRLEKMTAHSLHHSDDLKRFGRTAHHEQHISGVPQRPGQAMKRCCAAVRQHSNCKAPLHRGVGRRLPSLCAWQLMRKVVPHVPRFRTRNAPSGRSCVLTSIKYRLTAWKISADTINLQGATSFVSV